jgi:hypothetical protein
LLLALGEPLAFLALVLERPDITHRTRVWRFDMCHQIIAYY